MQKRIRLQQLPPFAQTTLTRFPLPPFSAQYYQFPSKHVPHCKGHSQTTCVCVCLARTCRNILWSATCRIVPLCSCCSAQPCSFDSQLLFSGLVPHLTHSQLARPTDCHDQTTLSSSSSSSPILVCVFCGCFSYIMQPLLATLVILVLVLVFLLLLLCVVLQFSPPLHCFPFVQQRVRCFPAPHLTSSHLHSTFPWPLQLWKNFCFNTIFQGINETVVITLIIRHVALEKHVGIFIVSGLFFWGKNLEKLVHPKMGKLNAKT